MTGSASQGPVQFYIIPPSPTVKQTFIRKGVGNDIYYKTGLAPVVSMVEKPIGELSLFSVLLCHSAPSFTRDFILCVITHDVTIIMVDGRN